MSELEQLWFVLHSEDYWEADACGDCGVHQIGGVQLKVRKSEKGFVWTADWPDGSTAKSSVPLKNISETKADLRKAVATRRDAVMEAGTNSDWDELSPN